MAITKWKSNPTHWKRTTAPQQQRQWLISPQPQSREPHLSIRLQGNPILVRVISNEATSALWMQVSLPMNNYSQQSSVPTKQEAMAKAVEILASKEEDLTSDEITRRLKQVENLLQGFQMPQRERRELDKLLMSIAIRESNATDEARIIIHQIFKQLASPDDVSQPKRDDNGRIVPRTNADYPLSLLGDDILAEGSIGQSE